MAAYSLKVGQTQAFTVTGSDGNPIASPITVAPTAAGFVQIAVAPDNSFTVKGVAPGSIDIYVSATGYNGTHFTMTVLALPTIVVTAGVVS